MKKRFNATLIGMFVTGAIALTVIAIIAFGGRSLFGQTDKIIVYFDESIHGLDVGAPVKLRGVRIGRVTGLSLRYDPVMGRSLVPVVCTLDRRIISPGNGEKIDMTDPEVMKKMVRDDGLRARLSLVGITGQMFIELDFFDSPPDRLPDLAGIEPYAVVPAVPSALTSFSDRVAEIATRIEAMDFEGISSQLSQLLHAANRSIEGVDFQQLVAGMTEAAESVSHFTGSGDLEQFMGTANETFADLSSLVRRLDEQIEPVSENVAKTAEELRTSLLMFSGTMESVQDFLGPRSPVSSELTETLQRLSNAAMAIERLADYLERNPNALLSGRRDLR